MRELYHDAAETAVIANLLLDRSNLSQVGNLTHSDFYDRQRAALFRALTEHHGDASFVSLADRAAAIYPGDYSDLIAQAINKRRFAECGMADAVRFVLDYSLRRQVHSLDTSVALDPERPLDEVVSGLIQKLKGMHPESKKRGFVGADSLMPEVMDQIENQFSDTPDVSGMLDLDELIYGLRGGRFIVPIARPGIGKSLFGGQWALGCIANGHRVGFMTLEMAQTEVLLRTLASKSGIDSTRLFGQSRLSDRELERLFQAVQWDNWPLLHFNDSAVKQSEIVFQISQLKDEYPDLKAVVIDYIQLIDADSSRIDRRDQLGEISRDLARLAKDLKIDIVALAQAKQEITARKDRRPQINDVAESDQITRNAGIIIGLHREDYYDPDTVDMGIFEVNVLKHRNGRTGGTKMLFDKETQTLRNMVKR